jgi:voltage-gated potassium channel
MKSFTLNRIVYALILISIGTIIAESFHGFYNRHRTIIQTIDVATYVAFSLEYILRIWWAYRAKQLRAYALSFFGIIDLLAILPFFLPILIPLDSRSLRTLRLIRLVNIVKIGRHNKGIQTLMKVVRSVQAEVGIVMFASIIAVVFAGILMFYAEHQAQPAIFTDMGASIWWAVATLTTVGYGDIYPVTALGKILAACLALVGIGLVAVPAGLISAAYVEEIHSMKEEHEQE